MDKNFDLTQTESESWFAKNKKTFFFIFFHFFACNYVQDMLQTPCVKGVGGILLPNLCDIKHSATLGFPSLLEDWGVRETGEK